MKSLRVFIIAIIVVTISSCCSSDLPKKSYQDVGPSVLKANRLLMLEYPNGIPSGYTGEQYKKLLHDQEPVFYAALEPYSVNVKAVGINFVVRILDGNDVVLIDASCTESQIECWVYLHQCDPDTFDHNCLH